MAPDVLELEVEPEVLDADALAAVPDPDPDAEPVLEGATDEREMVETVSPVVSHAFVNSGIRVIGVVSFESRVMTETIKP